LFSGWDYGFDSIQRKPILVSKDYLIFDRYERKSHIYYHKKIKLSISDIAHFEIVHLPQEIQAKIKGKVELDHLAIITISLNGGEILHLIRYDSIISNLEDSLRSLNKSTEEHPSEIELVEENMDIRISFSNSFNFSIEKNIIIVVNIFFIILSTLLISTSYSNGSFWLIMFSTVFSTSLITLGIVGYSDYTIRMPQQITITDNGLEIRFKRKKMKQVDWGEVIGVSDLNEGKFSELALNIGRPYMISLEISKNISKYFKKKFGYNLPSFGKYGAWSDIRDLRKNHKILERK